MLRVCLQSASTYLQRIFYCATRMHSGYCGKMSVCLSVCPSHAGIVPKRLYGYTYPQFFHHRVAPPFQFFSTKRGGDIPKKNPNGGVECKGYDKMTIFSQIFRSISETVIVRWAHAARQFVIIEFSFHPYNIQRDCPGGVPGKQKYGENSDFWTYALT